MLSSKGRALLAFLVGGAAMGLGALSLVFTMSRAERIHQKGVGEAHPFRLPWLSKVRDAVGRSAGSWGALEAHFDVGPVTEGLVLRVAAAA